MTETAGFPCFSESRDTCHLCPSHTNAKVHESIEKRTAAKNDKNINGWSLQKLSIIPFMENEEVMAEIAGFPYFPERSVFRYLWPSHANARAREFF
jgi:hypothetical protein